MGVRGVLFLTLDLPVPVAPTTATRGSIARRYPLERRAASIPTKQERWNWEKKDVIVIGRVTSSASHTINLYGWNLVTPLPLLSSLVPFPTSPTVTCLPNQHGRYRFQLSSRYRGPKPLIQIPRWLRWPGECTNESSSRKPNSTDRR